ncbi:MAG: dihydrolipoamide acetyltransferase family protein [Phycisphaerales bacterium]
MGHATSSDPNVFILPDLGEGVHEAELIAWKVKEGDTVEEHQILAEMETDKALVEVPSPRAGAIKTLHGSEGEILNVGNPLVTYEGGADAPAAKTAPKPAEKSAAAPKEEERKDAGTVVGAVSDEPLIADGGGKALAAPAVRRLARDLGVDINSVKGTGLAGRVTDRDVRAAAERGASAPATRSAPAPAPAARRDPAPTANGSSAPAARPQIAPPKPGETQKIPFRGVRRTIAGRLRQSVDVAVHFTVVDEADVSALDALRKRTAAASGEKLSYLPFVVSAVCRALRKFPSLNATVDDEAQEILRHHSIHMGMAVDTEHGLTVPVLADADALGVLQVGRSIAALAESARNRTIPREQLMGSTFTISNVGSHAGRFATLIINYPEVAILGVGRVRDGVVVRDGGIHIAKVMPLSLACDHRVVDGAEGALFLAEVISLLQNPEQLLAPARG